MRKLLTILCILISSLVYSQKVYYSNAYIFSPNSDSLLLACDCYEKNNNSSVVITITDTTITINKLVYYITDKIGSDVWDCVDSSDKPILAGFIWDNNGFAIIDNYFHTIYFITGKNENL